MKLVTVACVLATMLAGCTKKDTPQPVPLPTAQETIQAVSAKLDAIDSLTTFSSYLKNASLTDADVADGITVLSPVANAFLYPEDVQTIPRSVATATLPDTSVVKDYIIKGKINISTLADGSTLTALSGKTIIINRLNGQIYVNGILVTSANISNAVNYLIFSLSGLINQNKIPIITKLSDSNTLPGWVFAIYGRNFDTANAEVRFNGIKAIIHQSSPSQFIVTVPKGATNGKVTITANGKTLTGKTDVAIMSPTVSTLITAESMQSALQSPTLPALQSIAINKSDVIYLGDISNSQIIKCDINAQNMSAYAPNMQAEYDVNRDGLINSADRVSIYNGTSVTVSNSGNIYGCGNRLRQTGPIAGNTMPSVSRGAIYKAIDNFKSTSMLLLTDTSYKSSLYFEPTRYNTLVNSWTDLAILGDNLIFMNGNAGLIQITGSTVVPSILSSGQAFLNADPTVNNAFITGPLTADSAGNIYIADRANHRIWLRKTDSAIKLLAGDGTNAIKDGAGKSAQISSPYGITIDKRGNIYFCEQTYTGDYLYVVRMMNPYGVVSTIAGGVNNNYGKPAINGAALSATFNGVNSIAIDTKGILYIATDSDGIRKLLIQ